MVAADVTGGAKTPKWRFGRTKKGFSDPSPPKITRHIETVEVVFPGSPAGEEFSHSLVRRRKCALLGRKIRLLTSVATDSGNFQTRSKRFRARKKIEGMGGDLRIITTVTNQQL